jgi:hypothetical protein
MMEQTGRHPNILGWMLDEPMLRGVGRQQVEDHFRILDETDIRKEYFFWINEGPRGNISHLQRYLKNSADITGCDIYPLWSPTFSDLPNKTVSCIGEYTRRMDTAVENNKPIIMMLEGEQCFLKDSQPFTTNMARFEAFDAIINGARGITYFCQDGSNVSNALPVLEPVIKEINTLEPILVAPRKLSRGRTDCGEIEILHLHERQYDYWLCANRSNQKTALDLKKLISRPEGLKLVFGKQQTLAQMEDFGPYEVRVFTNNPNELPPRKILTLSN